MADFRYEIKEEIVVLSESAKGWKKVRSCSAGREAGT